MPAASIDRQIEKRLGDHDVRYTTGRRTVVAALDAADGPMSAAELHATIDERLPLSSIYRTLTVLEDVGVLAPHHGAKGVTRYELAEWLGGHHHHLICIECGSVEDVVVTDAQELEVDRVVGEISAAASFAALNHALEIEGQCLRCR